MKKKIIGYINSGFVVLALCALAFSMGFVLLEGWKIKDAGLLFSAGFFYAALWSAYITLDLGL